MDWAESQDFEKFVHVHLSRIVLFVVRLGATIEEAEDAVGDALTSAYQQWSAIRSPDAWVRTVAARNFTRAATRHREGLKRAALSINNVPEGISNDGLDICGEEAARVLRLLQQLPPQQRLVMALACDGYTIAEVAEIAETNQATVRSNLRHARHRLRALLGLTPPSKDLLEGGV